MSGSSAITIPAGHGKAFTLDAGATATITLSHGPQVVDAWAFCLPDLAEFLSCEHTRSCLEKLTPRSGDTLYSNRRRPILTLVADTSPGIHDLLLSACDDERYALLGVKGPHRNCAANLSEALGLAGYSVASTPAPFNVFENVSVHGDGCLEILPPVARKGNHVSLRAERDLVLVLSACPMDIAATNGADRRVKPVSVTVAKPG